MIVLSIIGILVAMGLLYWAFVAFNEHCDDKFGYCFFTKPVLIGLGLAGGLFLAGHYWYEAASADPEGDIVNGIVLMVISIGIYIGFAVYNFKSTNIVYGIIGTVIQFSLLSVIAYFGIILLSIYFVLSFLGSLTTERVVVVN